MKWYQMRWAQKYWGKEARERYQRYLQSDTWKTKRQVRFTGSPPDSDAVGVVRPQLRSTTRPTNESTTNECPI